MNKQYEYKATYLCSSPKIVSPLLGAILLETQMGTTSRSVHSQRPTNGCNKPRYASYVGGSAKRMP